MPATIDEARLKAESAEIEQLLAELHDMVDPAAWRQVEDVLRRLVTLYGVGLRRALEHARTAGADADAFDHAISHDELLASLLVLHGLHPLSAEQRVQKLIATLPARLGAPEGSVLLVGLSSDHVRLLSSLGEDAEPFLRRAIESVAPEMTTIEIAEFSDVGARQAI